MNALFVIGALLLLLGLTLRVWALEEPLLQWGMLFVTTGWLVLTVDTIIGESRGRWRGGGGGR